MLHELSSQVNAPTSNKKRVGGGGGCGVKGRANTVKPDELLKCENVRGVSNGGSASGGKNAHHADDKRSKPANLDSELTEEAYL